MNEINSIINLRKEVTHLQSMLGDDEDEGKSQTSDSEDDEQDEEEKERIQKALKGKGTKQRMAVSAEVYGQYNKKEDFVPKVIQKTAD